MPGYLHDFVEDASVPFWWGTNDAGGESVTRATDGTIKIERDDGLDVTGTSVTTDSKDDPDTGLHRGIIDTSDSANFAAGHDYLIWVDGAVIDGQTVNGALWQFSIENRPVAEIVDGLTTSNVNIDSGRVDVGKWLGTVVGLSSDYPKVTVVSMDNQVLVESAINPGAFTATAFAASCLDGKGDWNTVTPDAAGTAAGLHGTTDGKIDALNNFDGTGATLTPAYDAAKTAAQAGDEMDLVNDPNATAIIAIQNGLATPRDLVFLPLSGSATQTGSVAYNRLTAYQKAKIGPITIAITDADDQPVNLSGKDLALVAFDADAPGTAVFTLKNYGGGSDITVGGAENNQVTITGSDTNTATARQLEWILRNVTDDTALAVGSIEIKAAADAS